MHTFFQAKQMKWYVSHSQIICSYDQPRYLLCQTRGTDGWSEGVPGEDNYGCRDGRHLYMKRYLKSNIFAFSGSVFHKEPPGNNLFAHYIHFCLRCGGWGGNHMSFLGDLPQVGFLLPCFGWFCHRITTTGSTLCHHFNLPLTMLGNLCWVLKPIWI